MRHFLRKVVREVHRRAVWQVLGVFLAGSWGALQVVDYLTEFVGLPGWAPTMAFVLLLIGLPVVVTTAFIQEGVRGLLGDPDDEIDPNELEGLTPDQVHRNPQAHLLAKATLFTWRNAVLGGVGALALLLGSVSAYLLMWAFGIGPVGSLVAQGLLEHDDPVILADFENRTDDRTLGPLVTDAFRVDLRDSRVVRLVDGRRMAEVLRLLDLPTDGPITADLARELAVREGVRAVVEGEVSRAGAGYLLVVRMVVPADGLTLAAFRESVAGQDDLIEAVHRLCQRLREKAGESLRDIRSGRRQRAASRKTEMGA